MKNAFDITLTVRYDDLNMEKKLSTPAVLRYMQHAAIMHSDSAGNSLEKLQSISRAWVMLSWNYKEYDTPALGEEVNLHTVATAFGACYGYRSFTLSSKDGKVYAEAYSVWAFYDTQRMRPARVTPEILELYGLADAEMSREKPEVISFPDEAEEVSSFVVARRDTDTNHHVNNIKYIEMALDVLPEDFRITHMRASYAHSAVEGDTIRILHAKEKGTEKFSLQGADGKEFATVEFEI